MTPDATRTKSLDLATSITQFRLADLRDNRSYLALAVLVIAVLFFSQDLYVDLIIEDKGVSHILVEGGVFLAVLLALGFEVVQVLKMSTIVSISEEEITRLRKHLTNVIVEEFENWGLSRTEKEIALFLIKGFSMQEISEFRNVKEKSVRQQATGIYAKARVANRYQLTAYFIEDLLAPEIT